MSPFPRPVPWRGRSSTAAKRRDRDKWQLSAISFDLDLRRVAVEATVAVPTHEITDYVLFFFSVPPSQGWRGEDRNLHRTLEPDGRRRRPS